MIDSQREITTNNAGGAVVKGNSDQSSAKHLMNEFLNNQQVNALNTTGSKASQMSSKQTNRMLSANKNSSQPGLPMTD